MGSVVIQLYAGDCTPSVDRALKLQQLHITFERQINHTVTKQRISIQHF